MALNEAQAEAFRAYMHDLNRQAAIAMGGDPDDICPECGDSLKEHTPEALTYHKELLDRDASGRPVDVS